MSKQKVPLVSGVVSMFTFQCSHEIMMMFFWSIQKTEAKKRRKTIPAQRPHSESLAAKSFSSAMKPLNTGQRKDDDPAGSANLDVFR